MHELGANVFHGSLALNMLLLITLCVVATKDTDLVTEVSGKNLNHNRTLEDTEIKTTDQAVLRLEKRKEESTCGAESALKGYNMPLHILSLFVVLIISIFGCTFPLFAVKFPRLRIPSNFLFVVRHFGTGVLLATAFVHLLPTAFISLLDPCLSSFWTDDYPAMPGAIALAAVFLVAVLEMVFGSGQHLCRGNNTSCGDRLAAESGKVMHDGAAPAVTSQPETVQSRRSTQIATEDGSLIRELGVHRGNSTSLGRNLSRMDDEHMVTSKPETARHERMPTTLSKIAEKENCSASSESFTNDVLLDTTVTEEQKRKKEKLQLLLLELGILFHSIFIGMALSVTAGSVFVILWIAVSFHRK